jgi:hypothetical protein
MDRLTRTCGAAILGIALGSGAIPGAPLPSTSEASKRADFTRRVLQPAVEAGGVRHGAVQLRGAAGSPSVARGRDARAAALDHLRAHGAAFGLRSADLDGVELRHVTDTGRGGVLAVFGQRFGGVAVDGARLAVLMTRDLALVAIGGGLAAPPTAADAKLAVGAVDALSIAWADANGADADLRADRVRWRADGADESGAVRYRMARDTAADDTGERPARAWQVLFPTASGTVPAWRVEIFSADPEAAWSYVVDARVGGLLERRSLIDWEAYDYTVWAGPDSRSTPLDGPQEDWTPHPNGAPDGTVPPFLAPEVHSVESLHAPPGGGPDPWLPANATVTTGNNVDAYADLYLPDGFSDGDVRPDITAPGTFDYVYDTTKPAVHGAALVDVDPIQTKAAAVQLFYTTNWLHDDWYESGFDEAAGNAQHDNYGRGGAGGDRMLAESDDSFFPPNALNRNNASMMTPADGMSPRMQMFVWDSGQTATLSRTQPAPLTFFPNGGGAGPLNFGPDSFDVTAELALAVDGSTAGGGTVNDLCQLAPGLSGKIALADLSPACTPTIQNFNATNVGALGLILVDNVAQASPPTLPDGSAPLPTQTVTQAVGAALKAELGSGSVTMRMFRTGFFAGPTRSGALDNLVVAHEWGHYLHRRLQSCLVHQCSAQSEGWADFVALHMASREGDDLDGTYGNGAYAADGLADSGYYGIRRFPYSTDMTKSPLTFRHITAGEPLPTVAPMNARPGGNSGVHNAGEIWAAMLWEAYMALRADGGDPPRLTFAEARRRMADYVVLGLQLAPPDSTYTESRDALLAAAWASDPLDAAVMAAAFAKRGAGTCAVAPDRESTTFAGVVESFTVNPVPAAAVPVAAETDPRCAADDLLDGYEKAVVSVTVRNLGAAALDGSVTLSSSLALASVAGPSTQPVTLAPGGSATLTWALTISGTAPALARPVLTATFEAPGACTPQVVSTLPLVVEADDAASTIESVESPHTQWTFDGAGAAAIWRRQVDPLSSDNFVFHADDVWGETDTSLVSPPIQVGAGPLTISFSHRYDYEVDPVNDFIAYDAGVVELSTDGGATWQDVSAYGANPGYPQFVAATNPLGNRLAYCGKNAAWPARETVVLAFGSSLQHQTVRLRFRSATDLAGAAPGWDIDDVTVTGAVGMPFRTLVPDVCEDLFADDFETGGYGRWLGAQF